MALKPAAAFVPWSLEIEEATLRALRLRAARDGIPEAALARALLRQALAAEINAAPEVPSLAAVIQNVVDGGSPPFHGGPSRPTP